MKSYTCDGCSNASSNTDWYHDKETGWWYCRACTRMARRDAKKESESAFSREWCDPALWPKACDVYAREFLFSIRDGPKGHLRMDMNNRSSDNDVVMKVVDF